MRKSKRKTMEIKKRIGGGSCGGSYFVRLSKIK
jgi:hypothetical protein